MEVGSVIRVFALYSWSQEQICYTYFQFVVDIFVLFAFLLKYFYNILIYIRSMLFNARYNIELCKEFIYVNLNLHKKPLETDT